MLPLGLSPRWPWLYSQWGGLRGAVMAAECHNVILEKPASPGAWTKAPYMEVAEGGTCPCHPGDVEPADRGLAVGYFPASHYAGIYEELELMQTHMAQKQCSVERGGMGERGARRLGG